MRLSPTIWRECMLRTVQPSLFSPQVGDHHPKLFSLPTAFTFVTMPSLMASNLSALVQNRATWFTSSIRNPHIQNQISTNSLDLNWRNSSFIIQLALQSNSYTSLVQCWRLRYWLFISMNLGCFLSPSHSIHWSMRCDYLCIKFFAVICNIRFQVFKCDWR